MRQGFFGLGLAVVISMFGGPFIVVQKVVAGLRAREISALPAAVGVIVAGMWSVCAGIFYVQPAGRRLIAYGALRARRR